MSQDTSLLAVLSFLGALLLLLPSPLPRLKPLMVLLLRFLRVLSALLLRLQPAVTPFIRSLGRPTPVHPVAESVAHPVACRSPPPVTVRALGTPAGASPGLALAPASPARVDLFAVSVVVSDTVSDPTSF